MSTPLSSWARRRAGVAAETAALERAQEEVVIAEEQTALTEKSDDEILQELGLPDPANMVQGDDFKAFLSKSVPAHLRKRALRTLWRSNPVLACVDGLNDYDDDYLTGSFGQDPIKTSYQVGKGMLAHVMEMQRQKEAMLAPSDEVCVPHSLEEVEDAMALDDEGEVEVAQPDGIAAADMDDVSPTLPKARRMTFEFEDGTL